MAYNLTGIGSNSSSLLGMVQGINSELTFGWFFTILLFGIMVILFVTWIDKTGDTGKSALGSLFIGFGLSLLLYPLGLISPLVIYVILVGLAAALMFSWKK